MFVLFSNKDDQNMDVVVHSDNYVDVGRENVYDDDKGNLDGDGEYVADYHDHGHNSKIQAQKQTPSCEESNAVIGYF